MGLLYLGATNSVVCTEIIRIRQVKLKIHMLELHVFQIICTCTTKLARRTHRTRLVDLLVRELYM